MRLILLISFLSCQICLAQTVQVGLVSFEGNSKTDSSFLQKVILIETGSDYNFNHFFELVESSRNNLINTNLFTTVDAILTKKNQTYDVTFKVIERWFLWPVPYAHIHETNFNTWLKSPDLYRLSYGLDLRHYNLLGKGVEAHVSGRLGYVRALGGGIKVPFVGGSNWSFKAEGSFQEYAELVYATQDNLRLFYRDRDKQRIAAESSGAMQVFRHINFTDYISLKTEYSQFKYEDSLQNLNQYFPPEDVTETSLFRSALAVRFDRRDNKAYPLKGWFAHGEISTNFFDQGEAFIQSRVDLRSYQKLNDRWYTGVGIKIQNTGKNAPYYLVNSLGYNELIRSFEDYVIDGAHTFLFKSNIKCLLADKEIEMPNVRIESLRKIPFKVFLSAFVDAGYVSSFENNFSNSLQDQILSGFGVGLDFTTIYDRVIRMEMSYNEIYQLGFFLHFTQPI